MLGQQQHVVAPLPQRRQIDRHHVQAEIKVLAEPLRPDHVGQVLVAGGQQPGVGVDGVRSAHADQQLLFDHAEQLGLAGEAQFADFVEEERAAGGQLELALAHFAGVGERPFFVPEQLALGQRFGNGRAVDGHERLVAAAAEVMDRLGDDLLAGAVFAQDQHGQIGLGHAPDDRAEGLDGRALADQPHLVRRFLGDLAVGRKQLLAVLGVFQGHGRVGGQLDQGLFVFRRETCPTAC